jgi:hypothetical protein
MTKEDLVGILTTVSYKDNFSFYVGEDYIQLHEQTECNRSGKPYLSKGRKWKWSQFMTKSEVVTTCMKAVLQYEEHEARENFKYKGLSIFDPHMDVEKLYELRMRSDFDDVREDPNH